MRVLSHADIAALARISDLVPIMAGAMRQVSRREVEMPPRFVVPLEDGGFGVMAGAMAGTGHGAKFLTLKHRPGASSHIGALVLLDRETGAPALVLDSGLPTALRTAAVSAVATQALARDDASVLAILGTGEQARSHIEAMRAVKRRFDPLGLLGRGTLFGGAGPGTL